MIKKLILLLMVTLTVTTSRAAKAYPLPFTITQSDGTQLTITGHGDEYFHWYTTTDGVILYKENRSFYVAAIDANGQLTPTSQLAHEAANRQPQEQELVARQNKTAFEKFLKANHIATRASAAEDLFKASTLFPHQGSPKAIVILVEFQDTVFSLPNPRKSFDQYLNGKDKPEDLGHSERSNYGSVRSYFSDMSFGKFTPQFDIYGPVKLSKKLAYYGKNEGGRTDVNFYEMITEACTLMNDSLDFSKYDANNDGFVDLVYLIYAGYAESIGDNDENCIWPKSGGRNLGTFDGKTVHRFGVNNELNGYPKAYSSAPFKRINGIGLFCHEFSHCMGLPDLYENSSGICHNNQELEYWDLMDGGEYVLNGYLPSPYSAWEREAMGWFTIETLTDAAQVELTPIQDGGKAYRIYNDNDASKNEYYIVENVQERGWYNAKSKERSVKGHGMLVYHVDYDANAFMLGNLPNGTYGHPRMTLIAADGNLLSRDYVGDEVIPYYDAMNGDPFPGTAKTDSLTDLSKGSYTYTEKKGNETKTTTETWQLLQVYNGEQFYFPGSTTLTGRRLGKPLYNIKETDGGLITFDFMKDFSATAIGKDIVVDTPVDNRIFTIDGRYVGTDKSGLPAGIYIIGKRKVYVK